MKHLYWTGYTKYGRANEFVTERMRRAGLCDPLTAHFSASRAARPVREIGKFTRPRA